MLYLLPYGAVLSLLLASAISLGFRNIGGGKAAGLCETAAVLSVFVAMASTVLLGISGTGTGLDLTFHGFGFSSRVDVLSMAMLLLVATVGWIVLRYSRTYLRGEPGQAQFVGWISLTIAAVMLLVTAGNLVQLLFAWICTSLSFNQLLLFYPGRMHARRAARKKRMTARLSDLSLLIAVGLLGAGYGTGDIAFILENAASGAAANGPVVACGFLAVAAMLKSAQFPTHGWLTEVMETPTPVSALLHAGLINAGGFLLIRFADIMLLNPSVLAVLAIIGGFTALFASLVMLTQPTVKTSLAWSTIAQMGFMIFQCGLALFPLALLHILAHSLYKAHAFLSAGNAVLNVAAIRRPGPVAAPNAWAVGRAITVSFGLYLVIGLVFGLVEKTPQAIALGGILIFGVAYLVAQGFADEAPMPLTVKTALYAVIASVSYFALQSATYWLTQDLLPAPPAPRPLEWALIILSLISFGLVAFAQSMFPAWSSHPAARDIRVHLANGLYVKAVFDRLLGGWVAKRTPSAEAGSEGGI
ncbi:proton-conducting transporter membrane subunit [Aestuariispira insulae]|uniref:proton-conducting transporter transmembrane domain-containing protein n=1 Tax=Aestuariispira insulae TaxID=1461337 RepID=UPI001FEC6F13|nr:proton-conducting transporter membrane subunit [Aestuariispira insulae]